MKKQKDENYVTLSGTFQDSYVFSHKIRGEKIFRIFIENTRRSGKKYILPVLVPESLGDLEDYKGRKVKVKGQFHSYNQEMNNGKSRLALKIFAQEMSIAEETKRDENKIFIRGKICKESVLSQKHRKKAKNTSTRMLSVERNSERCDYLPCVAHGRNAILLSYLKVGTIIEARGCIQSRQYRDRFGKSRIAYEILISCMFTELDTSKEKL